MTDVSNQSQIFFVNVPHQEQKNQQQVLSVLTSDQQQQQQQVLPVTVVQQGNYTPRTSNTIEFLFLF